MSDYQDPLDSNYVEPSSVSFWPIVTRYGLIGGLILIIFSLLGIVTGLSSPANWMMALLFTVVLIGIYVAIMVMSVKQDRDGNLGGFIMFGRAFLVAFVASCIAALVLAVFNTIYMGAIDPEYMMRVGDDLREMYENMGFMTEEQIDEAITNAGADQPQTIASAAKNQASGYIFGAIIGALIALIVAAATKKVRPPHAMA